MKTKYNLCTITIIIFLFIFLVINLNKFYIIIVDIKDTNIYKIMT